MASNREPCLLEKYLMRHLTGQREIEVGRICVDLSNELEKRLRFKTIERFGGKKGDLSRAVEEAVKVWVDREK